MNDLARHDDPDVMTTCPQCSERAHVYNENCDGCEARYLARIPRSLLRDDLPAELVGRIEDERERDAMATGPPESTTEIKNVSTAPG